MKIFCFQSFEAELKDPLKKYGAPKGLLLLANWNGQTAGCIDYTSMQDAGICEMKRLYVRPQFRSEGIGRQLVEELLNRALQNGYTTMRLDTLQKLQTAIRMYAHFGFSRIDAYYSNPLPGVVYMEKRL